MINLGDIKGTPVTVMGLEQEDIKYDKTDFGQQLLPLVEDVLFTKCLSLLKLLEPDVDTTLSRSVLHPRIMRLSDKVSDLVTSNMLNTQDLAQACDEWNKSFQQQCSVLHKIIENMEKLIVDYFCGSFSKNNADKVKNLSVEIDSFLVKVKTMILEVENNLYTGDSVMALRKIKTKLTGQIKEMEREMINTKTRLEQYQKCGPELSDVVTQYAKLQKEIEMKKWALAELQNK